MKKIIFFVLVVLLIFAVVVAQNYFQKKSGNVLAETTNSVVNNSGFGNNNEMPKTSLLKQPNISANLELPKYFAQTFNNCGPASLAMVLDFWGGNFSQEKIAEDLRPFNTANGGIDDKAVFIDEMANYAKLNGLQSIVRPNGTIEKLQLFTTNGIPVIVTAWLHQNEDIGHYRIVKGFDESEKTIITDDSYLGPNQTFSYDQFLDMWKPFNYSYLVIYPDDKKELVNQILADETDQNKAYQNAISRAETDLKNNPNDFYSIFNIATANYYLGDFDQTIAYYERVESKLPKRMLWYQLEPIYAYHQTGNDQKAIKLTDQLLNNGNLAFSEMYQLKGEIFLKQGDKNAAKEMFEKALYYNKNYDKAKESLKTL